MYEESTGKEVPIKVVKTEDMSAGMSAIFLKAGASTKETKEFPFSSRRMYQKLRQQLSTFPTIDLANTDHNNLPEYFWTQGFLWLGPVDTTREDVVISQDTCFRLDPLVAGKGIKSICLVTNDVYFSTGYDQVLQHARGAASEFNIKVNALIKLLSLQEGFLGGPLCTPLVIERE